MSHGGAFKGDDFFWWGFVFTLTFLGPSIEAWDSRSSTLQWQVVPDSVDSKEGRDWPWGTNNQGPCQGDRGVNIMTP